MLAEPEPRERRIVERLTYLASVAIEHDRMIGALTLSEERFRRAFEDNAVAMGLLDTGGAVTRANAALRELTGREFTPASTSLLELVLPADRPLVTDRLARVRTGRDRVANCEFRLVGRGGDERTVSATMSLVRGASGEPLQVSVAMLDVTERLAALRDRRARREAEIAQQHAEEASRAKSAFLSAVSHEMRTPLQAITGFAELLGTLELDSARHAEALGHIATGAAHLLELVDDTLDLSRIEAAALPLELSTLPIRAVIDDVVDFLAPVAREHGVRLTAGPRTGQVVADARRLRQVLINLVSNGIRYSGPSGEVEVAAQQDGTVVGITVADNGPGIPESLRTRLFEPFVRSEPTAGPGVGLGLMLARGITEAMGGRLEIRDREDGAGTLATVALPQA